MDPIMIYILDEKISDAQLKEQLEKTQPLTKEGVIDLIISKIDGQDETNFMSFEKRYTKSGFLGQSNQVKYDTYLKDLANLENLYENLGTWNDPNELRSDLITNLISFHIVDGKTVLYNNQIQDWINEAGNWRLLYKKRVYLTEVLVDLKILLQLSINYGQAIENDETLQFVPEKWYALLHIILISLNKKDPIPNLKDKTGIMKLGKVQYKFQGTGQGFYQEIKNTLNPQAKYFSSRIEQILAGI